MDNKLSEPVAWTDAEELRDLSKHRCAYMFIIDPANPYHDPRRQQMLYSQEYVSVLLAELEKAQRANNSAPAILRQLAEEKQKRGEVAAATAFNYAASALQKELSK
ncbi:MULTISPECIES: hypothetical protein [Serratia]|uniref:hypothetical protein n=1 Tax=Serratia TaxID=613 RepID=UPI000F0CF184|nr:hypothetical protein [Serratia marcescens]QDI49373.1 hypothetical protein FG173_22050 [Serratia marcescens]BBG71249.1 hypothetical protein SERAS_40520 [Serratia marcescens]